MNISNHCKQLIEKGLAYHPLYGKRLADHLPMALLALDRMGASTKQLNAFYESYVPQLNLITNPTNAPEPITNPVEHLGNWHYFFDYLRFYQLQLSEKGSSAAIEEALEYLIPGLSANAFHAMIRLAYAIEGQISGEICHALAFWACDYREFELSPDTTDRGLFEIAKELCPISAVHKFSPGLIIEKMVEISRVEAVKNAITRPQMLSVEEITRLSIDSYAQTGNFTLLHAVTGCHAFRVVSPMVNRKDQAVESLWAAILMALLSTKLVLSQQTDVRVSRDDEDWTDILAYGCESKDAHDIKVIYSCWQESRFRKQRVYHEAASRVAGL